MQSSSLSCRSKSSTSRVCVHREQWWRYLHRISEQNTHHSTAGKVSFKIIQIIIALKSLIFRTSSLIYYLHTVYYFMKVMIYSQCSHLAAVLANLVQLIMFENAWIINQTYTCFVSYYHSNELWCIYLYGVNLHWSHQRKWMCCMTSHRNQISPDIF